MTSNGKQLVDKLQAYHLDALQEVGNIGAGHSATALSQLLNRRVDMSVPFVDIFPIEKFSEVLLESPEAPVVAVLCETTGDIYLQLVVLFSLESVGRLYQIMRKQDLRVDLFDIPEIDREFLREVGNILLLHYVVAINDFMDTAMYPQVPRMSIDMGKAIIDSLISEKAAEISAVLSIRVDIFTDNSELNSNVLMLPTQDTLDRLMTGLFGEGWSEG